VRPSLQLGFFAIIGIPLEMQLSKTSSSTKQSAGILLFRRRGSDIEVLLGHPGGPFWKKKDLGAWSIPKGLTAVGEPPLDAAKREFAEETGYTPRGKFIPLGEARQPGGKIVHVWAVEDDWNPQALKSNMFEMEWPPRSGKQQSFPELDRAVWFDVTAARERILKGQAVFLDRLIEAMPTS
jgi:predicted NUDIX family NTP pyrophosphohydrolase